jgi:hypothetical protein
MDTSFLEMEAEQELASYRLTWPALAQASTPQDTVLNSKILKITSMDREIFFKKKLGQSPLPVRFSSQCAYGALRMKAPSPVRCPATAPSLITA